MTTMGHTAVSPLACRIGEQFVHTLAIGLGVLCVGVWRRKPRGK